MQDLVFLTFNIFERKLIVYISLKSVMGLMYK